LGRRRFTGDPATQKSAGGRKDADARAVWIR
jgi:hypothetical protein